jgi:hypothetical protein
MGDCDHMLLWLESSCVEFKELGEQLTKSEGLGLLETFLRAHVLSDATNVCLKVHVSLEISIVFNLLILVEKSLVLN